MTIDQFKEIIKDKKSAPFLFLGSGFTRHYLNTPDWESLLSHFAKKHINAYYTSLNTKDLSVVASEIAKECNTEFWNLPDGDSYKKSFQDKAKNASSVLKDKISSYLIEFSTKEPEQKYTEELKLLSNLCIDGIITTNWDDFCERQFQKFQKFIGQKELLLSESIVSIGEIYKIHGCMRDPESLVLTQTDYDDFNRKNTYLAAKLITIFIEHPIVFIGYSMNDKNIKAILTSIVECLDQDDINKLQSNLFFVEWNKDEDTKMNIERYDMQMSKGITLPVIRINTHEFKLVYECLSIFERQMPTSMLRFYKQQFYDIIRSEKPEKTLYVLPEREMETNRDIQFVCGFGTIAKYQSAVGYVGLTATDIFKDIVSENSRYESATILTKTIPQLRKGNIKYLPIYRYLQALGINNNEHYNGNQLGINIPLLKLSDFRTYKSFSAEEKEYDILTAINKFHETKWRTMALIPFLSIGEEDLDLLKQYIIDNFNDILVHNKKNKDRSWFKKLICFYDWKKFGW